VRLVTSEMARPGRFAMSAPRPLLGGEAASICPTSTIQPALSSNVWCRCRSGSLSRRRAQNMIPGPRPAPRRRGRRQLCSGKSEHPRQSTANFLHLGDSAAGRRCSHHRSGRVELNLRCLFLVLGEAPAASLGIAKCRCCAIGSLPPPLLLQAQ
jgi:hypothetical protein